MNRKGKQQRATILAVCKYCRREYWARPDGYKSYCSRKCQGLFQRNRVFKKCGWCKIIFETTESRDSGGKGKFCSKKCCDRYKIGKRLSEKTEFKKGSIPWNKEMAGMGVVKANSGSFKKGHIMPEKWKGLGGKAKKGKIYVPIEKQKEKRREWRRRKLVEDPNYARNKVSMYILKNPEKRKINANKYARKARRELRKSYLRHLLPKYLPRGMEIPKEIYNAKKERILAIRMVRKFNEREETHETRMGDDGSDEIRRGNTRILEGIRPEL